MGAAITVELLLHFAEYLSSNSRNNERLDRCFENALVLMESLWSGRDGDSPLDGVLAGMTDSLGNYFHERGLWRLGRTWHERAIALCRSSSHAGDESSLAHELFQQATLLSASGEPEAAREALKECQRLNELAGNQRGVGAALHELAIIESAQGNPSEARRLLQRSLAILESLGDQRGSAASLHQLAMIEAEAGNRDEARQLWDRSIRIKESIGDVAGAARTQTMLAQLEAMEGRFERAIELASQAVRELEQLGYAHAEQARGILRWVELVAAQGGASSVSSSYTERLQQTLTVWKSLSPDDQSERLAKLAESSTDDIDAVLIWLAHSVVCCQQDDINGCDAAISQARAVAEAQQDGEVLAFVARLRKQLDQANCSRVPAESVPGDAVKLIRDGNLAAAEPLLAHALAEARAAGNSLAVATCQFYLGQVALMHDRPADAVKSLREALELATQVGETDLIHVAQDALTVATQAANETAKP